MKALQSIGYETIASGDSYNDLGMIQASKAGFLFKSTDKIRADHPELPAYEEFGDLLFALVNACRLYGRDTVSALERSNIQVMNRLNYMEECASSEGHTLHELSLDRMEELWQQAKHAAAEKE